MSYNYFWTSAHQQPFDAERAKQLIATQYESVYANTTVFIEHVAVDALTVRLQQALEAMSLEQHVTDDPAAVSGEKA